MNTKKPFSKLCAKTPLFEEGFFYSHETYVHPTAIIGPKVRLANNVKIGPYCIITGDVIIDEGTRLYSHVTVGFPAQNIGTTHSLGSITIGKNCHIREFVSIHASKIEHGATTIGNNCYIMNFSHIGHDVILEDHVTVINNVNIGGHCYIESNVVLMANSALHQFCRIGAFSCVAPFSATRQDLPPFCLFSGQPIGFGGLNVIGLKRAGIDTDSLKALKQLTSLFYTKKVLMEDIKKSLVPDNDYTKKFIAFIESSKRGVSRRIMPPAGAREHTESNEGEL